MTTQSIKDARESDIVHRFPPIRRERVVRPEWEKKVAFPQNPSISVQRRRRINRSG